ncbi:Cyclic nucleotide-binding domain-containing protein [Quadrisphaera granulorum]|uniref:Transmembrane secretion effector n=1 Tax=Quadrisphaera granulorum TaxID=317664 RepID=A0A316AC45_9ACTN|nr:MFS transporter [Quadrisphaera granulorum]PWJ54610.1 transmembrane secretion effector [Quadrisphaera granulorum]SZE95972.1 Cyclic nucleotide-binding domain-containing protein [Quadrisphaera granulorum]
MASSTRRGGTYRAALTHPGFRWLTLGSTVSELGDLLYVVALAAVVFDRTASAAWVTGAVVVRMLPLVILPPLAGALAERVDRRRLLLAANAVMALLAAGMAVATAAGSPVLVVILLATAVNAASTVVGPAVAGLVPTVVPERDLAAANAVTGSLSAMAVVVGPAAGAVLLLLGSPATAFALNAATFVVAFVCLLALRSHAPATGTTAAPAASSSPTPDEEVQASEAPEAMSTTGVARLLLTDSTLAVAVSSVIAACFTFGATSVLFVVVSLELLGTGTAGAGYLLAAAGAGGLVGAPLASRIAAGTAVGRAVVACVALSALCLLLLAVAPGIVVGCALALLLGGAYLITEVLMVTLLQRHLPTGLLGRASGLIDSAAFASILLGSLLSGVVVELAGVRWALVVVAVLPLLAAVAATPTAAALDRASRARVEALAPRTRILAGVDALTGASPAALERLAEAAAEERVAAGAVVVREGDAAVDVFVVVEGALAVSTTATTPGEPDVPELGPQSCFGEIGLLHARPRTATVTALVPCTLLRLPGNLLLEVVRGDDALETAVGLLATTRLRRTHPTGPLKTRVG